MGLQKGRGYLNVRKTKKTLAMLLTLALSVGAMSGCGDSQEENGGNPASGGENRGGNTAAGEPGQESRDENSDNFSDSDDYNDVSGGDDWNEEQQENAIRENGSLPEDADDLTDEERAYYAEAVFRAVQELDIETLTLYSDKEDRVSFFESVKNDAEACAFWNEVVGSMYYYGSCDVVLHKAPNYMLGKWFEEMEAQNAELPDDTGDIPKEQVLDIFNKYYADAPYVAGSIMDEISIRIVDGYFKCNLNYIFDDFIGSTNEIAGWGETINYGRLLFGEKGSFGLGYDYIREDIPQYETLLSLNLDENIKLIDAMDESEKDDTSLFYRTYLNYYKNNEEARAVIQKYLDESCFGVRTLSIVYLYYPADFSETYPYYQIPAEEQEKLAGVRVYAECPIFEYPNRFGNCFSFFYDIARMLEKRGEISSAE